MTSPSSRAAPPGSARSSAGSRKSPSSKPSPTRLNTGARKRTRRASGPTVRRSEGPKVLACCGPMGEYIAKQMQKPAQYELFPASHEPTLRDIANAVKEAGIEGLAGAVRAADTPA